MPGTDIDGIKLRLAMAFGQGAGHMQAHEDALEKLLAKEGKLISNAVGSWGASHWAFIELTRTLGQLSAAKAAADSSARISLVAHRRVTGCGDGDLPVHRRAAGPARQGRAVMPS